jgi:hypothetical protein
MDKKKMKGAYQAFDPRCMGFRCNSATAATCRTSQSPILQACGNVSHLAALILIKAASTMQSRTRHEL